MMFERVFRSLRSRFDPFALAGFGLVIVIAWLVATVVHHELVNSVTVPKSPTKSAPRETPSAAMPSSSDIEAANAAVLAYCSSDLRQGTSCALMPDSDQAAPGFVKVGLKESGSFAGPDESDTQGVALTKGSGSNWSVIWVGQGCVPKDIAAQNGVPAALDVCAS